MIDKQIDRQTQTDRQIDRYIDRQIDRLIDRQIHSQIDRQTDRQIDRSIDKCGVQRGGAAPQYWNPLFLFCCRCCIRCSVVSVDRRKATCRKPRTHTSANTCCKQFHAVVLLTSCSLPFSTPHETRHFPPRNTPTPSTNSTPHTLHSTRRTLRSTLHTSHFTLCTLHTLHCVFWLSCLLRLEGIQRANRMKYCNPDAALPFCRKLTCYGQRRPVPHQKMAGLLGQRAVES